MDIGPPPYLLTCAVLMFRKNFICPFFLALVRKYPPHPINRCASSTLSNPYRSRVPWRPLAPVVGGHAIHLLLCSSPPLCLRSVLTRNAIAPIHEQGVAHSHGRATSSWRSRPFPVESCTHLHADKLIRLASGDRSGSWSGGRGGAMVVLFLFIH